MRALAGFIILLLTLTIASCGMNQREKAALGCYDVLADSTGSWPVLQFTDEKFDYNGYRWQRIITHDPVRKLSLHSLWRFDGDTLHLIFAPDNNNVSDNYGSWASLQPTDHGYSGMMTTETLYTSDSKIELTRRSCDGKP